MPKKMTPKSQPKIPPSPPIFTIPIFNYFFTLKKYHANKFTILSFNCIMRIYSNVYNCAIYLKLLVLLLKISINNQALVCIHINNHTLLCKHINNHALLCIHINNHALLCIHINNHTLLYIQINTQNNYHKKYT